MRRDGARVSERSSSAQAANSGSEKSWPRIATNGPKQAGTSSSSAIASARSCAPARRASRASSASVPATAATCAICAPAARRASRAARRRARRARGRSASRRSRRSHRGRRRECRRRSAIARPSSASHGPSAASTLSSAANAVIASAASPPGRARARSGSPRLGRALMALNLVGRRSASRASPFGRGLPRRTFVVLAAPSPQSVGGSPVFGRKWVRPDVMGRRRIHVHARGAGGHRALPGRAVRRACASRARARADAAVVGFGVFSSAVGTRRAADGVAAGLRRHERRRLALDGRRARRHQRRRLRRLRGRPALVGHRRAPMPASSTSSSGTRARSPRRRRRSTSRTPRSGSRATRARCSATRSSATTSTTTASPTSPSARRWPAPPAKSGGGAVYVDLRQARTRPTSTRRRSRPPAYTNDPANPAHALAARQPLRRLPAATRTRACRWPRCPTSTATATAISPWARPTPRSTAPAAAAWRCSTASRRACTSRSTTSGRTATRTSSTSTSRRSTTSTSARASRASGDMTGDGQPDIAIGAPQADYNGARLRLGLDHQRAPPADRRLHPGVARGRLPVDQAQQPHGRRRATASTAPPPGDQLGTSLAGIGDQNGDGIRDLAIGAAGASPNGRAGAGEVVVVPGAGATRRTRNLAVTPPLQTIYGARRRRRPRRIARRRRRRRRRRPRRHPGRRARRGRPPPAPPTS